MRRQDKLKVIMEANQRLEVSYLNGKGLVNEALNKELKEFGPYLEKKLISLGFKVKLKINQDVHTEHQEVVNSNPKEMLALINYYNYSGSELLNVTVHKDNAKYLEKLVSYFNLPKTEYGPNKEVSWYVKNVRNVNPGDIVITQIYGGQVSFYRAGEKGSTQQIQSRRKS
jgi:hypothetical protein